MSQTRVILLAILSAAALAGAAGAHSKQRAPQPADSVKLGTSLVNLPVVVSDRNNAYVTDLRKQDFLVYEDGAKQEIAFFGIFQEPFHVILMLDSSLSAQEKFGQIQQAASAFLAQLQTADEAKVISFDDEVRDHGPFTKDRSELRRIISTIQAGKGTKLYDAMRVAIHSFAKVEGRKAIVIFTDGVDWHSDQASYDENVQAFEKAATLVYPIRFDTRKETEEALRRQQASDPLGDTVPILRVPPRGTTPPANPGGERIPVPELPELKKTPSWNTPLPPIFVPKSPDTGPASGPTLPTDRFPDGKPQPLGKRPDDSISVLLDGYYQHADRYLAEIAAVSGGRLYKADTLALLPDAFSQIAAELRNQYSLGYYPSNTSRDDSYRKIQVKVSRKNLIVRTRPGYVAPADDERRP